jgi:uncharacterized protein YqfA (UPF0365 family)
MDYYNLLNVQADTRMRNQIGTSPDRNDNPDPMASS